MPDKWIDDLPEITSAVESCFKAVGPDVDSFSTPDGRPVYDFNLGVINHDQDYLLAGVKQAIRKHFNPACSGYEIQWRKRPHLHFWTDDLGNKHLAMYMRFATNPILSSIPQFQP